MPWAAKAGTRHDQDVFPLQFADKATSSLIGVFREQIKGALGTVIS
jgi:hypothetical protein